MSECPNVHDVQMPMMSKCPWCPNVHDVVTLVTCGHTFHMWSQLSQVVTLVTCGLMCHIWSHFSHVVTLVTRNQCFQCWPKSEFVDYDETRPTYRPARPQVKTYMEGNMILICQEYWQSHIHSLPCLYFHPWLSQRKIIIHFLAGRRGIFPVLFGRNATVIYQSDQCPRRSQSRRPCRGQAIAWCVQ